MLIKRLYLRNFRVYEDELELELPPGLVGIYGPNGAGKSTLLEAILFTLWGKARTGKDLIRSSGTGQDCITEVEFEHEGHLFLVRRSLKGINSTVALEAHCDGVLMSTGVRDAERYIESVLGLDDGAFRASVFTEQKQLAAFSDQSPAERRRLVLQLLGVTPLDTARDAARKDARQLSEAHGRLRNMLTDLAELSTSAEDSAARAEAAEKVAAEEARAAETASHRAVAAAEQFRREDERRHEHEALVAEGRSARQTLDRAAQLVTERAAELEALDRVAATLSAIEDRAAGRAADEHRLELLVAAAAAVAALESITVSERPPDVDLDEIDRARTTTTSLRDEVAANGALVAAAAADVARAKEACERSASLSGDGDCPTCGQPLGSAFETVQAHRASELREASLRHRELVSAKKALDKGLAAAEARLSVLETGAEKYRTALAAWEHSNSRRTDALEAASSAWVAAGGDEGSEPPAAAELASAVRTLRADVGQKREAENEALSIRVRLEARSGVEQALAAGQEDAALASSAVESLREKVRALGFRPEDLQEAAKQREATETASRLAISQAQKAVVAAAEERERARAAHQRLEDARAQHAQLADLETESLHTGRVADLLSEFRNTVVASVGPRLALHAAELFSELTDREYEGLDVDPETFQIQISDGGRLYALERFSGSEVDLANLALRVAISEHIHFQSGGSVGLLVLDEVFGPLDEDRKARMLLALERLRGRFRQVLVVTHDVDIKEQLPAAIEVKKRPGRRATAVVLD